MEFKYKTIRLFFDADGVPCAFVAEVMELFPGIENTPDFYKRTWNIGEDLVIAVADIRKW
jgi:hypothetical protein